MSVDTPAKIAILGAGPVGLEAALYARFLGYDVSLYEVGQTVAAEVVRNGQLRLLYPFEKNRSLLGLAAIFGQDENYTPPAADELLTCQQWQQRYLLPLSQTDLLADHIKLQTEVLHVGKCELLRGDIGEGLDRGDYLFRIHSRLADGTEQSETADVVIEATGIRRQPNWLGDGGIPAVGEVKERIAIEYHLPDILGSAKAKYAGRQTLVIGAGLSAQTNLAALATLAQQVPQTRVTWVTRRELDPAILSLPAELAAKSGGAITHRSLATVQRLVRQEAWQVEFVGDETAPLVCDEIIANVGYRPNSQLCAELQVGQLRLPELTTGEPHFYILGDKSFGLSGQKDVEPSLEAGLDQIRRLFAIIGDRASLDLYASAKNLLPAGWK